MPGRMGKKHEKVLNPLEIAEYVPFPEFFRKCCVSAVLHSAGAAAAAGLDVREVVVELAQVVVVPLSVHSWKDAAAGQLWQIL